MLLRLAALALLRCHTAGAQQRPPVLTGEAAAVAALYTASNPAEAKSPYHAFAHCPPTELFTKPTQVSPCSAELPVCTQPLLALSGCR